MAVHYASSSSAVRQVQTVSEVLRGTLRLGRGVILQCLRDRKVHLSGHLCQVPGRRVRPGNWWKLILAKVKKTENKPSGKTGGPPPRRSPGKAGGLTGRRSPRSPLAQEIRVRFLDAHIVVVDKPAGLTTVRHASEVEELGRRAQKFLPPTLVDLLPEVLPAKALHRAAARRASAGQGNQRPGGPGSNERRGHPPGIAVPGPYHRKRPIPGGSSAARPRTELA